MTPSAGGLSVARRMLKRLWKAHTASAFHAKAIVKVQIAELNAKMDKALDAIIQIENVSVLRAYRKKIEQRKRNKLVL